MATWDFGDNICNVVIVCLTHSKSFLMKWGKMFASYEISLKRYDEFKMTLEFTAPQYEMYQSSLCDNPEYVHPNQEVRLFTC